MIAVLVAACAAGFAYADEAKKDEKAACAPPPKELVTKDIKVGDGADVANRTPVLVGYTGWLYDPCTADHKGEMFDTSEKRVTPLGLIVGTGKVIKGWDEGLVGMKENGVRLLVIPPDKAYGDKAMGNGKIPPNSTLVFEVTIYRVLTGNASSTTLPATSK
jgi:FKBP-type peptidyl-prolyl cis-trans isomerase